MSMSVRQAMVAVSTFVPTWTAHLSVHVIKALVCHLMVLIAMVSNFSNTGATCNCKCFRRQ